MAGLCFNCKEKFEHRHNCVCQHIFLLDWAAADDGDDTESTEPDPRISLHAISGVRTSETMQVHIQLGSATVIALLDLGSTHNFISEESGRSTNLQLECRGNHGQR